MNMVCANCKKKNLAHARFCSQCGTEIQAVRPQDAGAMPEEAAGPIDPEKLRKIDGAYYLISLGAGPVFGALAYTAGDHIRAADPVFGSVLLILALAALLYTGVAACLFIYQMWSVIRESGARTTPGKAVGFLFIPFFNLYWVFQVFRGFSRDFNQYLQQRSSTVRPLNEKLFLGFSIYTVLVVVLSLIFPVLGFFLALLLINWLFLIVLVERVSHTVHAHADEIKPREAPAATPSGLRGKAGRFMALLRKNRTALYGSIFAAVVVLALIVTPLLPRPRYAVTGLEVPAEVVFGDRVIITAEASNTGNSRGNCSLTIFIEDEEADTVSVPIGAGSNETVEFLITEEYPPGRYQVSVGIGATRALSDEFTGTLRILKPAKFEISNLQLKPHQMNHSEETTVTVDVSNVGEASGSLTLNLKVNGNLEQVDEIALEGERRTEASFTLSMEDPGLYTISINGLSEVLEVFKIERPGNGTVMVNKVAGGYGHLRVVNKRSADAVVVLSSPDDPWSPLVAVYVRAQSSTTVRGIRDGTYITYFSHGHDWDSHSKRFTRNAEHSRFERESRYSTTHTSTGYTYSIITVEFGVINGDDPARTKAVNPDEFPALS